MSQEYIIENAERIPFREMSEANQITILKAKLNAPESVEINCINHWASSDSEVLHVYAIYRVIATPLVIPWEVIHPDYNIDRNAVIEECECLVRSCWNPHYNLNEEQFASNETVNYLIDKLQALKSQPAQPFFEPLGEPFASILHDNLDALIDESNKPDPRDEALRLAQNGLIKLACLGNEPHYGNSTGNTIAISCLAAIDEVMKGGS